MQDLVHDRWTWLDPYAAEKPEEFFAVVTEASFEEPAGLQENHPELFSTFAELYRVDPRAWIAKLTVRRNHIAVDAASVCESSSSS